MDQYQQTGEVVDSVCKAQEFVEINQNQCRRLAEVYNEIWQSLAKVIQKNVVAYNTALLEAFTPLYKVMEVGKHLISENAGPCWFKSLIKYADNKEAFQEVHRDLHFWAEHLLGIDLGDKSDPDELIMDACRDRQEMASKLIDMQCEQNQGDHVFTSGAGQEQVGIPQSFLTIAIPKLLKQFDDSPLLNSVGEIVQPQANCILESKLKASLVENRLVHVTLSYYQVPLPPGPAESAGSSLHIMDPDLRIPMSAVKINEESEHLGSGYSCKVKKAVWQQAEVAAKIFRSTDVDVLRKEVAIHQKLRHPNIVQLLGFSEEKGQCMILMDLLDFNLHKFIEEKSALVRHNHPPFPPLQAIRLMLDIAAGMHYVHNEHNLKHGDLKTENVLGIHRGVDNWQLKVADFGETQREITGKSGSGIFRAPEVLEGKGEYTFKSEVYSFAMISYEILTGHVPFHDHNLGNVTKAIIDGTRPRIPKSMDTKLQSLLQKYWHRDKDKRPTFNEICEELRGMQKEFARKPRRGAKLRSILQAR